MLIAVLDLHTTSADRPTALAQLDRSETRSAPCRATSTSGCTRLATTMAA